MIAALLPAATEQLALVAAFGQRPNDSRAHRLGMRAVLFEHERKLLADELRTRDTALAGRASQQPIVRWVERDRGRLLPRECHRSNMTQQCLRSKAGESGAIAFVFSNLQCPRTRRRRFRGTGAPSARRTQRRRVSSDADATMTR